MVYQKIDLNHLFSFRKEKGLNKKASTLEKRGKKEKEGVLL